MFPPTSDAFYMQRFQSGPNVFALEEETYSNDHEKSVQQTTHKATPKQNISEGRPRPKDLSVASCSGTRNGYT